MTKQEKSRIDREMRDRAMKAWHMAQKVSGVISIPYEIAALDAMIKELREIRASKAALLERLTEDKD